MIIPSASATTPQKAAAGRPNNSKDSSQSPQNLVSDDFCLALFLLGLNVLAMLPIFSLTFRPRDLKRHKRN